MAITVEEEKKPVNWMFIVGLAGIIAVIFAFAYYVLFRKPQLLETVTSQAGEFSKISQLSFQPEEVLNAPTFRLLRQYSVPIGAFIPGKSNPFQP